MTGEELFGCEEHGGGEYFTQGGLDWMEDFTEGGDFRVGKNGVADDMLTDDLDSNVPDDAGIEGDDTAYCSFNFMYFPTSCTPVRRA